MLVPADDGGEGGNGDVFAFRKSGERRGKSFRSAGDDELFGFLVGVFKFREGPLSALKLAGGVGVEAVDAPEREAETKPFLDNPHAGNVGLEELADLGEDFFRNLIGVETINEGAGDLGEDGLTLESEVLLEFVFPRAGGGDFFVLLANPANEEIGFSNGKAEDKNRGAAEREINFNPSGIFGVEASDDEVADGDNESERVEFGAQEPIFE